VEQLNSIFFYHLDRAIRTYRQYAQKQLAENGFHITIDQWLVLKVLSDNPLATQNELAEKVFKDKASVTRILEILVKSDFLTREFNEENRRRFKLTITKKGKQVLKDVIPTVRRNRKQALKDISEKEMLIAEKVLKKISMNCARI
jgi:MarR family transcriptional regulator, transcriptional regulator for hemolysin